MLPRDLVLEIKTIIISPHVQLLIRLLLLFLQGMYNSANYLVFVNYHDYQNEIAKTIKKHKEKKLRFLRAMIVTLWLWNQ